MSEQLRLLELFEGKRYQKIILTICVLTFLVMELLIYLGAASQAGQKSRVIVSDANGSKVYETVGTTLTSYEKLVFENTFGPLQNYRIEVQSESSPFPFRAWLSAAVGIPIGLVLLVSFLVRAYLSLLYGEEKARPEEVSSSAPSMNARGFVSVFSSFQRFSIFHVGFVVLLAVLLLWMVPNFLGDFAKLSITAFREFKWFFLGVSAFVAFIISWIIYLRYKLSKKMLENQLDLEKFRVEKQLLIQGETRPLLPNSMNDPHEHGSN